MKNVAASVRARLADLGRAEGVGLDFMIERFAMGRLLWRLSNSPEADQFVLKGAQLFAIWEQNPHRPTRDIDFLGFGDPAEEAMATFFTRLLTEPADPEDGLIWGELTAGPIRDDQRYGGIRIGIPVSRVGALVRIQVDIGSGDAITPAPEERTWNELLGYPAASLRTYPPETVIAEKLEAAVQLDIDNSRMKNFCDLDWLSRHRTFDYETLREAVTQTFERRGTALPGEAPFAFTKAFAFDATKQVQWKVFLGKNRLDGSPLEEIIARLSASLLPRLSGEAKGQTWNPESSWIQKSP